jgi:putative ABC transport system permease protein
MAIPLSYNIRNLIVRKTTTLMTGAGIALTVAVLLAVLGLVSGLQSAFEASGDPLHVLVMRKGGNAELTSLLTQEQFQIVKNFNGIASKNGQPMASLEVVTVINLPSIENPDGSNVTLRGLSQRGVAMRKMTIIAGRRFNEGQREIMVGKSIAKRYPAAQLGKQLRFGRGLWNVVGVMDGQGSSIDSEIFADGPQVAADYNRPDTYSSALLQATDEVTAAALQKALENDRRLNVTVLSEKDYYTAQTAVSAAPIKFLGFFVCIVMAVGSCFAAMNTMYAAVARRAKEVGTLRILGFTQGSILLSFFLESILLSLLGGLIACIVVIPLNTITTGVGNFATFSETSFNIHIGPEVMIIGVLFSLILGAVGGLLPARQAAKKEILTSLREV